MKDENERVDLARRQHRALRGLSQHALDPIPEGIESAAKGSRSLYHGVGNQAALRMVGRFGTDRASRSVSLWREGLGNRCMGEIVRRQADHEASVLRRRLDESGSTRSVWVQPKLRVRQPDAPLEVEANRVADAMVARQRTLSISRSRQPTAAFFGAENACRE